MLDEFDKLAARGSSERMAYSRGTQHALLKLVEGMVVPTALDLNTETILFVMGGAFTGLDEIVEQRVSPARTIGFAHVDGHKEAEHSPTTEDFIAYGIEPELLGLHIPLTAALERRYVFASENADALAGQFLFVLACQGTFTAAALRDCDAWLKAALRFIFRSTSLEDRTFRTLVQLYEGLIFELSAICSVTM